jgi:predicted transcriptional regulator
MDDQGVTITELAKRAEYPRAKLNNLLNGKKDANVATLEKIAKALGHHVALLPGDPPES